MDRERVLAGTAVLLGCWLLYVGWGNVGGLLPPFALCGYVGDPTVHVGGNVALVYNGGCTPYEFAYPTFAVVTLAGCAFLAGGVHLDRRHR